jgi:hypothetical protein
MPSHDPQDRALLDQLLADAALYRSGPAFKALLEFAARLRGFAPFNAMLLHIQRPGLTYAASAREWGERFGRTVKEHAIPLIILWPFGPVALVCDVADTIGADGSTELPKGLASFWARGAITEPRLAACIAATGAKGIRVEPVAEGDGSAGRIRVAARPLKEGGRSSYLVHLNAKHPAATRFCTLAHELAHLCLGHLGPDKHLHIPARGRLDHATVELEAEAVAYLVAARNGVQSESEKYLVNFVKPVMTTDGMDLYQVMRAAGQVEMLMRLQANEAGGSPVSAGSAEPRLFG